MNQGKLEMVKQEMARANLIQMTFISTTVGKSPLEEMEYPSWSTRESEMWYLNAISKTTKQSWFISKANHSTSQ